MPGLRILFLLTVWGVASYVQGEEFSGAVLAAPPVPCTDAAPLELPVVSDYFNSYPDNRCDEWGCCSQWWSAIWYLRVELLGLVRNHNPQDRVLIQSGPGQTVFSTDDLEFSLAPGLSTLFGHRINGISAVELSYFGANQWNEERSLASGMNLSLAGALGAVLNDFNLADVMEISLRSQLHNAEINYLRDLPGVTLLAGFRYLNWQEQLQIHTIDSDLDESDYHVDLSNNLCGGQIGLRMARFVEGLELDLTGKAGLFGNEATQAQRITNLDGTSIVRDVGTTNGALAFVGDLNFSANCSLTRVWRIRGGFNLIYVSGLALAFNQLDFSNSPSSGRRVRQDADVFLHGFNVGLEAIW